MWVRNAVLTLLGLMASLLIAGCPPHDLNGPTAGFSAFPLAGAPPLGVAFEDRSYAGDLPISDWLWDFGDGATDTAPDPTHIYTSEGVFTVSLTVTTGAGSHTKTREQYITVTSDPLPPMAAFSASPYAGTAMMPVTFTDESTPGSEPITSWQWLFGDGGSSDEQNPEHTYRYEGVYEVTLTVTSAVGSDTTTAEYYVSPEIGPACSVSASPQETRAMGPQHWAALLIAVLACAVLAVAAMRRKAN